MKVASIDYGSGNLHSAAKAFERAALLRGCGLGAAARLVGGASWRRTVTLREPTADPARLRAALGHDVSVIDLLLQQLDPS